MKSTTAAQDATLYYPEYIDKLNINDNHHCESTNYKGFENRYQFGKALEESLFKSGVQPACVGGYIQGSCSSGHSYYKAVFCGKEYCQSCGRDGSVFHRRRFARWMPKAKQFQKLGYLVVTIPEELRSVYKDRGELSAFRTGIKRKLQSMGYMRGLCRYHFFGDCGTCSGFGCDVCNQTGAGSVYKPHLNIFIDQGYMQKDDFEYFKKTIHSYIRKYWLRRYAMECVPQFHFSYAKSESEVAHHVKYVTRATFKRYNERQAKYLYAVRGMNTWGKWETIEPAMLENDEEKLEYSCCTQCEDKKKVSWRKFETRINVQSKLKGLNQQLKYVTNGYYTTEESKSQQVDRRHQRIVRRIRTEDAKDVWGGNHNEIYRSWLSNFNGN